MIAPSAGLASLAEITGVVWERPQALVLLAVPLLVLLLARRLARPHPRATGTLELWRRAADESALRGARESARIPPPVVWLAVSLASGVLALASPWPRGAAPRKSVRVVVDRSPSMYLDAGQGTRLARALDSARSLLAGFDEIAWIAPPAENAWTIGTEIPRDWLAAPRVPRPSPDFAQWDEAGSLWITDRAPVPPPRNAGFAASGGAAVPGPIAATGTARIDWDGQRLAEVRDAALPRRAIVVGAAPAPIVRMLAAWAAARGLGFGTEAVGDVALELRVVSARAPQRDVDAARDPQRDVDVARDNWWAHARCAGEAPLSDADGPLLGWLEDPITHAPLLTAAPGRIATSLVALDEPRGDPAAFAVSWSRLLDACALPPRGVVALDERVAAGDPRTVAPRDGTSGNADGGTARPASPFPLWLSALACATAMVAAWLAFAPSLSGRSGRAPSGRRPRTRASAAQ